MTWTLDKKVDWGKHAFYLFQIVGQMSGDEMTFVDYIAQRITKAI